MGEQAMVSSIVACARDSGARAQKKDQATNGADPFLAYGKEIPIWTESGQDTRHRN